MWIKWNDGGGCDLAPPPQRRRRRRPPPPPPRNLPFVTLPLIRMYGAVTSQNLWSRYDRHFVGKTWHNVRNRGAKIYRVIQMSTESFWFKKMFTWSLTYQRSAYLSNITVTKISQRFTHKMAAKNGRHRHETKLHSLSRYVYQHRHRHYRSWHKSKVIFFTYTDPRRLGLHVRYSLNAWK